MTHNCIKPTCGKQYEDSDPDAYYCPECVAEKKQIAASIDARLGRVERTQPVSDLQAFDMSPKFRGFVITKL